MISKTQVDRLGERLKRGSPSDDDLRALDEYRRSFGEAYDAVVQAIKVRLKLEATGRPAKSTPSIVAKLARETIRLTQIQDIAGCRVVVSSVEQQDRVLKGICRLFEAATLIDRRKTPSYGYRAVHVVVVLQERAIEVQVRTKLQHLWAQVSEKLSDIVDPELKYGGGPEESKEILSVTSTFVANLEGLEGDCARLSKKIVTLRRMKGVPTVVMRELSTGLRESRRTLRRHKRQIVGCLRKLSKLSKL